MVWLLTAQTLEPVWVQIPPLTFSRYVILDKALKTTLSTSSYVKLVPPTVAYVCFTSFWGVEFSYKKPLMYLDSLVFLLLSLYISL